MYTGRLDQILRDPRVLISKPGSVLLPWWDYVLLGGFGGLLERGKERNGGYYFYTHIYHETFPPGSQAPTALKKETDSIIQYSLIPSRKTMARNCHHVYSRKQRDPTPEEMPIMAPKISGLRHL